jgi:hypothetical protein
VIPPERAGMASGISGTMRFTGIVLGFAALGVVLFSQISAVMTSALPALDDTLRSGLIRDVASGDLSGSGSGIASASGTALHALALKSFAQGYTALFAASAVLCLIAAILCWRLIRASDTPPIAKKQRGASATISAPLAMAAKDRN